MKAAPLADANGVSDRSRSGIAVFGPDAPCGGASHGLIAGIHTRRR
jgi:hypothetical protein